MNAYESVSKADTLLMGTVEVAHYNKKLQTKIFKKATDLIDVLACVHFIQLKKRGLKLIEFMSAVL